MRSRTTLAIFTILVCAYGLAWLPALFFDAYLDSPAGLLGLLPYLSVHVLHKIGIPGVLEHGGLCGWGWCAPTPLGMVLAAVLWLGLAWILAAVLARGLAGWRGRK